MLAYREAYGIRVRPEPSCSNLQSPEGYTGCAALGRAPEVPHRVLDGCLRTRRPAAVVLSETRMERPSWEGRSAMRSFIAKTTAQRAAGNRPSRTQAFVAAAATAVMLGAVAYKLLRSGE